MMIRNNIVCKVIGIRNISLRLHDGTITKVKQVRHVLNLKRNLISLRMLDQMGYNIKLESNEIKVINRGTLVMKGTKMNSVYILDGEALTGLTSVSISSNRDKTKLWHLRLWHMNIKDLKELEKHGVLGSGKIEDLDFYEDYVQGKSK